MEYNKEQILRQVDRYFQFKSVCDIVNDTDYLGQGVSRTAYSLPETSEFIIKFGIGDCADEYDGSSYNEYEKDIYLAAEEEDLSQYFLPTEVIGELRLVNDLEYNFYDNYEDYEDEDREEREERDDDADYMYINYAIQPRISHTLEEEFERQVNGRYEKNSYKKEKTLLSKKGYDERYVESYAYPFIRQYGLNEYLRFQKFIEYQGIDDLHTANWGYHNGKLVCIDYAM